MQEQPLPPSEYLGHHSHDKCSQTFPFSDQKLYNMNEALQIPVYNMYVKNKISELVDAKICAG